MNYIDKSKAYAHIGMTIRSMLQKYSSLKLIRGKKKYRIDTILEHVIRSGEQENKEISESELKLILEQYNLSDALVKHSQKSFELFDSKQKFINTEFGTMIPESAFAYLANLHILSGADDSKVKKISENDNHVAICNIYTNCLKFSDEGRFSFITRVNNEQFIYQRDHVILCGRGYSLFTDILSLSPKSAVIEELFLRSSGLTFQEFFFAGMLFFAYSQGKAFSMQTIYNDLLLARISKLNTFVADGGKKLKAALSFYSFDYEGYRKESEERQRALAVDEDFSRSKPNILNLRPLVLMQNGQYVIPSFRAFFNMMSYGLYWRVFDLCEAESPGGGKSFKDIFGKDIFENYVGKILASIFKEKIEKQYEYEKGMYTLDWHCFSNEELFFFEAKAYQFPLVLNTTGDQSAWIKYLKKNIEEVIVQINKRIDDIESSSYKKLDCFHGKKISIFVIFYDIPLITCKIYQDMIREHIAQNNLNPKGRAIYFLDIEDLESIENLSCPNELLNLLDEAYRINGSFKALYSESRKGQNRRNHLIVSKYEELMQIYGIDRF